MKFTDWNTAWTEFNKKSKGLQEGYTLTMLRNAELGEWMIREYMPDEDITYIPGYSLLQIRLGTQRPLVTF